MDNTLLTTLIAGSFALIGTILGAYMGNRNSREINTINSELEIAKFREQWIQCLRDTLAEFQSYAMLPDSTPHLERKFYELGTKIELLLNPNDPAGKKDYQDLQKTMYAMLASSSGNTNQKYRNNPHFIDVSQRILEREWDRVKKELRYHYWKV